MISLLYVLIVSVVHKDNYHASPHSDPHYFSHEPLQLPVQNFCCVSQISVIVVGGEDRRRKKVYYLCYQTISILGNEKSGRKVQTCSKVVLKDCLGYERASESV